MKLNKTFKKSISLILTIIMIFSTMVVGVSTANAAITAWYVAGTFTDWNTNRVQLTNNTVTLDLSNYVGTQIEFKMIAYEGGDIWCGNGNTISAGSASELTWNGGDNIKFTPSKPMVTFTISVSGGKNYVTVTEAAKPTTESSDRMPIFFKPDDIWWKSDGVRFAAHYFDANGNTGWLSLFDSNNDGIYESSVPDNMTSIIFTRMNPNNTTNNWDNCYNQTPTLTIPTNGTNLYTITRINNNDMDQTEGSWSKPTNTWYITGRFAVNDNGGKRYATENDEENWCTYPFSVLPMTKVTNTLHKLQTNLSIKEIGANDPKWYIHLADGQNSYYPASDLSSMMAANAYSDTNKNTYTLSTSTAYENDLYFSSNNTSTELVTLWLDSSVSGSPKFFFTLGDYDPTAGTTTVNVPNVVGKTQAEAKTAIEALGLTVNVTESYSDTVAAGSVISSNPAANTSVEAGSSVTIVVSKGPEPTEDKVAIPNVIGDDVDTATTKITDAGLNTNVVYEYDDTVAENLVIRISPAVGTLMDKEAMVTIYVSKGKEPVTEPSIPSGTVLTNVKIYFKGTNLKSLTPSLTINGTSYPLTRDTENGYIGTYYNGSYRFYWYTATIPQVTVGENYSVTIKTSGSLMNAVGTLTFATCNENNEIYLAVDNMQTGAAFEDITHNETAKVCFRSSANMITNVTNQFDPNKTLAKVMLTLLNADGTTTTSKYSIGDTNADGTVNIKDATVAQMMSANIVEENSTNSILGDYDVSGDVNVKDATGIQTYIVNC